MMKKLSSRIAVVLTVISLSLAAPTLAGAHEAPPDASNSGPLPMAAIGSVFGGAMWLVSTPFCLLLAPTHVMDSFDTLVLAPWRTATGED